MRLNHFISQAGIASRRSADILIEQKKIKVNGKITSKLGTKIDPLTDIVEIQAHQGNVYSWKKITQTKEKISLALYKPTGFVTSLKKQGSAPLIKNLVPRNKRLFPVGRLDKDSEGLIIMTNDGSLSQELMHPKKHISRTYEVTTVTPKDFTENILKSKLGRLAKGVRIKGHQTLSCVIELVRFEEIRHRAIIRITLHEGKNRQIRRMLGSINLQVLMLVRISIGGLTLDDLKLEPGKYLQLRDEHIKLLFH